ncbi:MAG: hypothetical protein EHM34_00250 [Nitrosopumilales archaeon]|nr:MAG: hypothetical protein EHM34_00250 [Nitrosopumilales archaeon]
MKQTIPLMGTRITLRKLDLLRYVNDELVIFFGVNKYTGYCRYRGRFTYRILNDLESIVRYGI